MPVQWRIFTSLYWQQWCVALSGRRQQYIPMKQGKLWRDCWNSYLLAAFHSVWNDGADGGVLRRPHRVRQRAHHARGRHQLPERGIMGAHTGHNIRYTCTCKLSWKKTHNMQFSHDLKKKKKQLVTCFRQNLPRIKNLGAALFSIKPCQNNLVSKGGGPIHANVPLITPPPLLLAFVTLMMRPGCCNEGSGHYLWKWVRVFGGEKKPENCIFTRGGGTSSPNRNRSISVLSYRVVCGLKIADFFFPGYLPIHGKRDSMWAITSVLIGYSTHC